MSGFGMVGSVLFVACSPPLAAELPPLALAARSLGFLSAGSVVWNMSGGYVICVTFKPGGSVPGCLRGPRLRRSRPRTLRLRLRLRPADLRRWFRGLTTTCLRGVGPGGIAICAFVVAPLLVSDPPS